MVIMVRIVIMVTMVISAISEYDYISSFVVFALPSSACAAKRLASVSGRVPFRDPCIQLHRPSREQPLHRTRTYTPLLTFCKGSPTSLPSLGFRV